MNSDIEMLDKKRMRYLEWYLIGLVPFMILSVTRFFFRLGGLNSRPIGQAVFIGLILSLLLLAISTIGSAILGRTIRKEPSLKDALHNELVQSLEVQSWKAAYLGAVGTTIFFAAAWFFYPISDPVLVALTSIIAGAGAYQATFYFKYRSS
jgi:drug/metabolite transporter (DMT)-like permease